MTSRHKLDAALAAVATAVDKIKAADEGLARLVSVNADDVARELAQLNARETDAAVAAYARGEIVDLPQGDAAARADIMRRLAEATSKREAVERVRSQLQNDKRDAIAMRTAAEESIPVLAAAVSVEERLPKLIDTRA
jgi:hypothetical protein